jgi:hypothetical protein
MGYAFEIPGTAHSANGISISNSYFASDGTSMAAIHIDNSAAFLSVTTSRFDGYASGGFAVQNDSASRILFIGNDLPFSGARETSSISGLTSFSNSTANVASVDARFSENVIASRQLQSNAATGIPPLVVSSSTRVGNLNADLLDGRDWNSPGGIGLSAPATGAFTSLTTGRIRLGGGTEIRQHTSVVVNTDFSAWAAAGCQGRTIPFAGAVDGDSVVLGVPSVLAQIPDTQYTGFVSSVGLVTIRACKSSPGTSVDPAPAAVRVDLWKH